MAPSRPAPNEKSIVLRSAGVSFPGDIKNAASKSEGRGRHLLLEDPRRPAGRARDPGAGAVIEILLKSATSLN
jgi:hypothetical protein